VLKEVASEQTNRRLIRNALTGKAKSEDIVLQLQIGPNFNSLRDHRLPPLTVVS
jgi:hypothetical protein